MGNLSGVLNINKEKGYTSQDVVAVVRKTLGHVKAGHTGTLDPQAEGVLPVCIGAATKIADYIGDVKAYRAELILGISTDTEDITGQVLARRTVVWDETEIRRVIQSFVGDGWQTPPMYSAVKVGGRKLYELARKGAVVERKARPAHFDEITVLESRRESYTLVIQAVCAKGAYIRTLCADIGRRLGCGGCMGGLTRLRSGPFLLENSVTLGELKRIASEDRLETILYKIEDVLAYPRADAGEANEKALRNGHPVERPPDGGPPGSKALLTLRGEPAGIYTVTQDKGRMWYKPVVMLIRPLTEADHDHFKR